MTGFIFLDAGGPFLLAPILAIVVVPVIALVEAIFFYFMRLATFGRCFGIALLANVFSTLAGFVLVALLSGAGSEDPWTAWAIYAIAFGLTVLIEGFWLAARRPATWPHTKAWQITLWANVISYALLLFPLYAPFVEYEPYHKRRARQERLLESQNPAPADTTIKP